MLLLDSVNVETQEPTRCPRSDALPSTSKSTATAPVSSEVCGVGYGVRNYDWAKDKRSEGGIT